MKVQFLRFSLLVLVAVVLSNKTFAQSLLRLKGNGNPKFIGTTGFYSSGNNPDTLYYTNGRPEGTVATYKRPYFFQDENRKLVASKIGNFFFFYSLLNSGTLVKSDGTAAGTTDVKTKLSIGSNAVVMQNLLYFSGADNPDGGNNLHPSLWKSDGTTSGTVPVKSTTLNINRLSAFTNKLLFAGSEGSGSTEKIGSELWISDGTDQGTRLLKDIFPGVSISGSSPTSNQSDPSGFQAVGNKVVFFATDEKGRRMWVTDGTETGTILLQADQISSLNATYIGVNPKDGTLYFVRKQPDKSPELWGTDGTPDGTQKIDLGSIKDVSTLNYLLTNDGFFYSNGTEIRQIKGTQTSLVFDTKPLIKDSYVSSSNPSLLGYLKGVFYLTYLSDNRVARTDGTAAGSYILTNATGGFDRCNLGTFDRFQDAFFTINGKVYLREYGTNILFTRIDQKNGKDVRVEVYNKDDQFNFYAGSTVVLNDKYVGNGWIGNYATNYFPLVFDPGTASTQSCFLKTTITGNPSYVLGNLPLPCTVNGTTSLSATVTDGTAPFSYQWLRNGTAISGATSATYAAGSTGDYTVLTTDGQSCSATSPARTVVPAQPMSVTLAGADVVCTQIISSINYVPTIRANISGGTAPFSYRWALASSPLSSTTAEQRVTSGGIYSLTVTDACSSTVVSKTLTESVITVTVSGAAVACTGQPTALTASATGGKPPYTYSWTFNNGPIIATTPVLSATAANGSYRVAATSADGCSWFADTEKGGIPKPVALTIIGSTTLCSGQPGTLNASVIGGTAPYTYQWKLGNTVVGTNAASLSITTAGVYSLSVTDACSSTTASVTVTESPSVSVKISGELSACTGQPTTLSAVATGGTGAYNYQWKQGSTNVGTNAPSLTATGGNTYSLAVTDAKGCAATSTVSVSAVACALPTVSLPTGGATATAPVTLTANTGLTSGADAGATYQWLLNGMPIPGATNPTYTASISGSYAVSVTLNGRTTTSPSVTVTINLPLAVEPLSSLLESQVTVYPNPTTGECWVMIGVASKQAVSLQLVDGLGKSVRQWNVSVTPKMAPIRVSLPDTGGLYFLRVETEQGTVVKKVIKK